MNSSLKGIVNCSQLGRYYRDGGAGQADQVATGPIIISKSKD